MQYIGHKIDKSGLYTTDKRIYAIKNVPVPVAVTELKSFLEMVIFYNKFIPNTSTILKPLYSLLKKGNR